MSDETVTVRSTEQIHAVVAQILGFHPTDSLVVMGVGGGPTARMDTLPFDEVRSALTPALPHWGRVILVGYDAGYRLLGQVAGWLTNEGIDVAAAIDAPNGAGVGQRSHSPLDARQVLDSRDALEAEAASVTSVTEAETVALAAYDVGQGARAWAYLDRAVALGSTSMGDLRWRLENAVKPGADR